jgi:TP901-1 family phage major tail protein
MAAQQGKNTLLYADLAGGSPQSYTLIPGLQDTNWSVNGQQVEVTNKDSGAWRQLLTGAGVRSLDIEVSGIFQDAAVEETVRGWAFDQSLQWWQIRLENADRLEFQAQIRGYTRTARHDGADEYSFTLESHGEPFYLAA